MNWLINKLFFFFLLVPFALTSCKLHNYAPVQNAESIKQYNQHNEPGTYIVQPGDTLYAIAWRYNLDYRTLAQQNHISPPYIVKVGQVLSIKPVTVKSVQTVSASVKVTPAKISPTTVIKDKTVTPTKQRTVSSQPIATKNSVVNSDANSNMPLHWVWPAKGKIIAHYSPSVGQKGIDIAGQEGEPILAAATGKVAYAGNGLRGYGNLIIIKHSKEFLSAYAHNETFLVHEGEEVTAGQKIATMGKSESKRVMLHFEIREAGKSINPLRYVKP